MPSNGSHIDVTVVVAAYNAEYLIIEALQSALNQRDVNIELLVVDDASTDGTAAVVANLARSEPRLRLIRCNKNGGPGAARNIAFDQAKGDWIAVLDADDKFHADRLSSLLAVAREWDADMVADNLWLVDGTSQHAFDLMLHPANISAPREISAEEFVRNNQPINIKRKYGLLKPIIRRDLIDRYAVRYNKETPYGEDFLFYIECLVQGAKFVLIPEAYYFYELSRTQMTRTRSISRAESFLDHCNSLLYRDDIKAIPGLANALSVRSEQLRSNLVYLRFMTAFKNRRFFEALCVLTSRLDLVAYIALHMERAMALRLRQWFAGLTARGRSQTKQTETPDLAQNSAERSRAAP